MKKQISIILIIIVVLNFLFMALGKNNVILFWSIMIIIALFAYKILPRFKTR